MGHGNSHAGVLLMKPWVTGGLGRGQTEGSRLCFPGPASSDAKIGIRSWTVQVTQLKIFFYDFPLGHRGQVPSVNLLNKIKFHGPF